MFGSGHRVQLPPRCLDKICWKAQIRPAANQVPRPERWGLLAALMGSARPWLFLPKPVPCPAKPHLASMREPKPAVWRSKAPYARLVCSPCSTGAQSASMTVVVHAGWDTLAGLCHAWRWSQMCRRTGVMSYSLV